MSTDGAAASDDGIVNWMTYWLIVSALGTRSPGALDGALLKGDGRGSEKARDCVNMVDEFFFEKPVIAMAHPRCRAE